MNKFNINFIAKTENVVLARSIAQAFLLEIDPPLSLINEVKILVSEAVTNAIIHGYLKDESKYVTMNMEYDDEYLLIEVIDNGQGIEDVLEAMEPLYTNSFEEERAGLGLTIIEVLCDDLEIISAKNKGTKVIMKKKLYKNG